MPEPEGACALGQPLASPFPYFGGKSRIAHMVWEALGNTPNYIEPFFGSGAVLLARPDTHEWWHRTETVNDLDGFIANVWRAIQAEPDIVAHWADWPVNENDLSARHAWLVGRKESLQARLEGDPDFYDAQIAGWWLWGICQWIGGGWCSGQGPWVARDGQLVHLGNAGQGISRQLVHLGDAGQGINRKRVHLGGFSGVGVESLPDELDPTDVCASWSAHLRGIMRRLQDRLRRVRVCCGDWSRICGPTPTEKQGLTGVFLDPPYNQTERDPGLYTVESDVSRAVRDWVVARGDNPMYRIALCGYEGEHDMPSTWDKVAWKAQGGYANLGDNSNHNAERERIWFSPHCIPASQKQLTLW